MTAGDTKTLPQRLRVAASGFMALRFPDVSNADLLREAATALEAAEEESLTKLKACERSWRDKVNSIGRRRVEMESAYGVEFQRAEALQARLVAVEAAARHAKSQAAAPDYDEEAIRNALWAVVEAALASLPTEETA